MLACQHSMHCVLSPRLMAAKVRCWTLRLARASLATLQRRNRPGLPASNAAAPGREDALTAPNNSEAAQMVTFVLQSGQAGCAVEGNGPDVHVHTTKHACLTCSEGHAVTSSEGPAVLQRCQGGGAPSAAALPDQHPGPARCGGSGPCAPRARQLCAARGAPPHPAPDRVCRVRSGLRLFSLCCWGSAVLSLSTCGIVRSTAESPC